MSAPTVNCLQFHVETAPPHGWWFGQNSEAKRLAVSGWCRIARVDDSTVAYVPDEPTAQMITGFLNQAEPQEAKQ